MKKPKAVRWLTSLLKVKIILLMIITATAIFTIQTQPESGFLRGATASVFEGLNTGDPYANPSYATGYLLGNKGFVMLLALIQLLCFNQRKMIGFWIAWTIDLLFVLSIGGIPIFSIAILILALTKASKAFQRNKSIST